MEIPSEYISDLNGFNIILGSSSSSLGTKFFNSGDMYHKVPQHPNSIYVYPSGSLLVIPKSMAFILFWVVIIKLAGLTSKWQYPADYIQFKIYNFLYRILYNSLGNHLTFNSCLIWLTFKKSHYPISIINFMFILVSPTSPVYSNFSISNATKLHISSGNLFASSNRAYISLYLISISSWVISSIFKA